MTALFSCLFILVVLSATDSYGGRTLARTPYIAKRNTPVCEGGKEELKQGRIVIAEPTIRMIQDEAKKNGNDVLKRAWTKLSDDSHASRFKAAIKTGESYGLSGNETMAIFLYTMDKTDVFYKHFNTALREGNNKYPVFHYWLEKALDKLRTKLGKTTSKLYRGNSIDFTTKVDAKLTLPGFTSVSQDKDEAKKFLKPGCTMMILTSDRGVSIDKLSYKSGEKEVLIPPTEEFQVTKITEENGNPTIYLKPTGAVLGASINELSLTLVLVTVICSLYL